MRTWSASSHDAAPLDAYCRPADCVLIVRGAQPFHVIVRMCRHAFLHVPAATPMLTHTTDPSGSIPDSSHRHARTKAAQVVAYALARPAREVLFTVVSRDEKYRAKLVLDTAVQRFGDALAAGLFHYLQVGGAPDEDLELSTRWRRRRRRRPKDGDAASGLRSM